MTEVWKPVVGHDGYEVSSRGRVRSSHRGGRVLKPAVASNGYPTVALGRGRTRTLHSLVAEAFIGPRPVGMEVGHLDGDRANAHAGNLGYVTRAANNQQIVHDGRRKISAAKVRWARAQLASGARGVDVAAALCISQAQVSNIRHDRQYKTVD